MLNHLKILNSQKLSWVVGLFGLKRFYGFVSLAQLEDVTDYLFSFILYFFYFLQSAAVKTFKRHQYAPARTHKKS